MVESKYSRVSPLTPEGGTPVFVNKLERAKILILNKKT